MQTDNFLPAYGSQKIGVTLWSVVEPLSVGFKIDVDGGKVNRKILSKSSKPQDLSKISRSCIEAQIKDLVETEKLELSAIPERLGVSLTTVRRVCRTLKIGPYGVPVPSAIASRSSQPPFGWDLFNGYLRRNKVEWPWVEKIHALRIEGHSLHKIAAFLQKRKVPTKNGGRWFAKTISQILTFNSSQFAGNGRRRLAKE